MGKVGLAFTAFFRILMNKAVAEEVETLFRHAALPKSDTPAIPAPAATTPKPPARSEALTLLSTLQREARLVDLVQEPLEQFADAQIGAAARDVLRQSREVLARLFDLQPVLEQDEGTSIEVPPGFSAAKFRLTGNVHGEPPFRGSIEHRGWMAKRVQLPAWTGDDASALILAPAEVALK